MTFKNKTIFITGSSRGIGAAIALKLAAHGANLVITGKSDKPHPTLPGTIYSVAKEVEIAGGRALAIPLDLRYEDQIEAAVEQTVARFGGIDVLINNASAISLTHTLDTPMKRFDLMFAVNVRGTYASSQACIPWLEKSANPHILTLAPPLNMNPKWFKNHLAYTMAKYGMSMCVLGMAQELQPKNIAVNALWPRTAIDTAALRLLPGIEPAQCRTVDVLADTAEIILQRDSKTCSGNFFIDEDVLRAAGITDLDQYLVQPDGKLMQDLFLD